MLSGSAMAQLPDGQESRAMRPKRVRMTQDEFLMGGNGEMGMPPGGFGGGLIPVLQSGTVSGEGE